MAQKWGSTKAEQTVGLFDAKKFNELCCVKAKRFEAPPVPDDVNDSNFRRLVAGKSLSMFCVVLCELVYYQMQR